MSHEAELAKSFRSIPDECTGSEDLPILASHSGLNVCNNSQITAGFIPGLSCRLQLCKMVLVRMDNFVPSPERLNFYHVTPGS
jgi:hypothetical protein